MLLDDFFRRSGLILMLAISLPVLAQQLGKGYVFGVTVNTTEELSVILDRADDLRAMFDPSLHSRIAIVLHGNELQLFQKQNYSANQSIVERARLLDEDNIIDIKACQTQMRSLDIQQSDLPSFIEQVPFAPAEIERLKTEQGFTRL
ncbi:MAG: intracellular sulfur oxidation DsrE/DsrF family protein [Gammaproteobacteria bacterium]|jgi:intracellular sulfur oxidation DsrE/DsrF family protein